MSTSVELRAAWRAISNLRLINIAPDHVCAQLRRYVTLVLRTHVQVKRQMCVLRSFKCHKCVQKLK